MRFLQALPYKYSKIVVFVNMDLAKWGWKRGGFVILVI